MPKDNKKSSVESKSKVQDNNQNSNSEKQQEDSVLLQRLRESEEFRTEIKRDRDNYCKRAAKGELYSERGGEFDNGNSFTGWLARLFIGEKALRQIAENNYNQGFKERSGVDLYKELGEEDKKKENEQAEMSVFWTVMKVWTAVISLVGAVLCGIFLSPVLGGGAAGVIGAIAIGAAAGAAVGAIVGAIDGYFEKQQTKDLTNDAKSQGVNDAKHAITKAESENNKVVQEEHNNVLAKQNQELLQRISALEKGHVAKIESSRNASNNVGVSAA